MADIYPSSQKLDVAGKRVHIIGLGAKGTGRACARVLAALGADITISDSKTREELAGELQKLSDLPIQFMLGADAYQDLDAADLIVPSPGVPLAIPPIRQAMAVGIQVLSEIELAYRLSSAPIVAITGTKGKTTTTTLIGLLLDALQQPVHVGGNIGYPLIELAIKAKPADIIVAEVSSFQLEAVDRFRPRVAVFTNLYPDHLDRYEQSLELYLQAKLNLFARQTPDDVAIINIDRPESARVRGATRARIIPVSAEAVVDGGLYVQDDSIISEVRGTAQRIAGVGDVRLRGRHNLANVLQAIAAVEALGLMPERVAPRVLSSFRGVPNRLEEVDTIDGVTFYNDSQGTTPDAVRMALLALTDSRPVLIAGGRAKVLDFAELAHEIVTHARALVTIGEAAPVIEQAVRLEDGNFPVCRAATLPEAVQRGFELARPSGTVVLSPACASFDMFTNMEHRGQVFRQAVAALRENLSG